MMPLTQRRCPARAPHRPEHRTGPSTAPTRAPHQPKRPRHSAWNRRGSQPKAPAAHRLARARCIWELRVVAFFRMRQIWSCADPGFGERSKSRANRYRDLPSTVNTESLEPASRPAQQIWSYERRSDAQCGRPGAKTWRALQIWSYRHSQRCASGVIIGERSRSGVKATCGGR